MSAEAFENRQELYNELFDKMAHVIVHDSELGIKVTKEAIDKEFTSGSFPHQFLNELTDDDEALQIAYELIQEVKKMLIKNFSCNRFCRVKRSEC